MHRVFWILYWTLPDTRETHLKFTITANTATLNTDSRRVPDLTDATVQALAKKCLLSTDDVNIWD